MVAAFRATAARFSGLSPPSCNFVYFRQDPTRAAGAAITSAVGAGSVCGCQAIPMIGQRVEDTSSIAAITQQGQWSAFNFRSLYDEVSENVEIAFVWPIRVEFLFFGPN